MKWFILWAFAMWLCISALEYMGFWDGLYNESNFYLGFVK